jgi:GGDEF domain-containing protein
MEVFDRIDYSNLEKREWQLWLMALTVLVVLTTGMALLMYPSVFSQPVVVSGVTMRKAFFGFCALSLLLVAYLIDRQLVIRQLRQQLAEEQKRITQIRHEASNDLLESLPRLDHFRDRLVMEFRRAAITGQPLSMMVIELTASRELLDTSEVITAFGDAAKTLTRKLRGEDSLYAFRDGVFGIVLPGVRSSDAYRVAGRLEDGLHDAAGASNRFSVRLQVVNYPEHAATAREMEEVILAYAPDSATAKLHPEAVIVAANAQ